jgi:RNA polymerase sigma-70 factor, ECF subfamily
MTATPADLKDAPPTLRLEVGRATVASADASGLDVALATHGGELFGFAYRTLRDRSMAEEAVQETFLRAWRARARYDASRGSMRTWLFAIERHVVVDLARARARDARLTNTALADPPRPDDQVERTIESWHVRDAIRSLRPTHCQVLEEIYYRQRTSAELAGELGIPEGTVRSRLFYALRALRSVLAEMNTLASSTVITSGQRSKVQAPRDGATARPIL